MPHRGGVYQRLSYEKNISGECFLKMAQTVFLIFLMQLEVIKGHILVLALINTSNRWMSRYVMLWSNLWLTLLDIFGKRGWNVGSKGDQKHIVPSFSNLARFFQNHKRKTIIRDDLIDLHVRFFFPMSKRFSVPELGMKICQIWTFQAHLTCIIQPFVTMVCWVFLIFRKQLEANIWILFSVSLSWHFFKEGNW